MLLLTQALVKDFYVSFEAVDAWRGYEKPKAHLLCHLKQSLLEFGPFRAYWCMPWEAFLQILKKMFRMCNWKAAPYTVGKHWAAKWLMHLRDPARGTWHANAVEPSSNFSSDMVELTKNSRFVAALCSQSPAPHALRFLLSAAREGVELCRGDWVTLERHEQQSMVGQVEQIAEIVCSDEASRSFIRLWCSAKVLEIDPDGTLWSQGSAQPTLVCFESMHVQTVMRTSYPGHEEYI